MYALIKRNLTDTGKRRNFIEAPSLPGDLPLNKPYWVPIVHQVDDQSTGPDIVRETPTGEVHADELTITTVIRDMTPSEIIAKTRQQDENSLREYGKDVALVLVEFIEWALANTSMTASDFSPDVRTAFQSIKTIADRLRNN